MEQLKLKLGESQKLNDELKAENAKSTKLHQEHENRIKILIDGQNKQYEQIEILNEECKLVEDQLKQKIEENTAKKAQI